MDEANGLEMLEYDCESFFGRFMCWGGVGCYFVEWGCVAIFGIFYWCLYVVTSHMGLSLPPQTLDDFMLFPILGSFDFGLFSSCVLFRYNLFCVSTSLVDCLNEFSSGFFVLVMVFSVRL